MRKSNNKRVRNSLQNQGDSGNRGRGMIEKHYREYDDWPWVYFTPRELASKSDGLLLVNDDAMRKLELFRRMLDVPFTPTSAYRSAAHNRRVGGSPRSQHLLGKAFDIPITSKITREKIHHFAGKAGFNAFGDYNNFVHIDTRDRYAYWDLRK